jgi:hypothetical protein
MVSGRDLDGPMTSLTELDPSLEDFIIFEEFTTSPASFTLNGFLFTLLGLYDWAALEPKAADGMFAVARHYFECGLATAVYALPYYDLGGFSAYDLGHVLDGGPPNIQVEYHAIHITLLHALNSIHPLPELAAFEAKWRGYVDGNG